MTVLDLGRGSGEIFLCAKDSYYRAELAKIQGKVAKVIGIGVDKAALLHPHLDECHAVEIGSPLPLPNASDAEFAQISGLQQAPKRRGRKPADPRNILNAVLYRLNIARE